MSLKVYGDADATRAALIKTANDVLDAATPTLKKAGELARTTAKAFPKRRRHFGQTFSRRRPCLERVTSVRLTKLERAASRETPCVASRACACWPVRTLEGVLRSRGSHECVGPVVVPPRDVVSTILKNQRTFHRSAKRGYQAAQFATTTPTSARLASEWRRSYEERDAKHTHTIHRSLRRGGHTLLRASFFLFFSGSRERRAPRAILGGDGVPRKGR